MFVRLVIVILPLVPVPPAMNRAIPTTVIFVPAACVIGPTVELTVKLPLALNRPILVPVELPLASVTFVPDIVTEPPL